MLAVVMAEQEELFSLSNDFPPGVLCLRPVPVTSEQETEEGVPRVLGSVAAPRTATDD